MMGCCCSLRKVINAEAPFLKNLHRWPLVIQYFQPVVTQHGVQDQSPYKAGLENKTESNESRNLDSGKKNLSPYA